MRPARCVQTTVDRRRRGLPVRSASRLAHTSFAPGYEGFKPATAKLRVATRAPAPQRLVLDLAALTQEITVSNAATEVGTAAGSNVDAITIDQNMLESLPVFDNDFIATMSQFLDAGSIGNGGVTIVVNGMEVSALNVSASAMQQIRINQDPYSAEYSRPGRGRVEILDQAGQRRSTTARATVMFRDARLNARNPFATTKPPENAAHLRRVLRRAARARAARRRSCCRRNDQILNQQSFIYALGPVGHHPGQRCRTRTARRWCPAASRGRSATGTRSRSGRTTSTTATRTAASAAPRWRARPAPSRTTSSRSPTRSRRSCRPTLLNQFQMLVGHEREPTISASPRPRHRRRRRVHRRRRARRDLLRTETHMNLNESLAWTTGHHLVQAGFQLPDWSRRGFYDRTNFGGTFYFSGLDTYAGGRPYAFTQQQGNGDLAFLEKQVGAYIKDDWQVRPGLSLVVRPALRLAELLSRQQQCRAARSRSPTRRATRRPTCFRAGVGVFNDRSGPVVIADVLHSLPGGLTRIRDHRIPGYPDPFASAAAAAVAAAEHRAARARRADSADAAVQRRPRSSAAEGDDAVADLHRRARLSPVPLARRQRAAAAALSRAARSRVRRRAADGIDRASARAIRCRSRCAAR